MKRSLSIRPSKVTHVAICVFSAFAVPSAYSQSSLQIGGFVSSGINYVTNVGGAHDAYVGPAGVFRPNTIFLKGSEDIGGDMKAIFLLSSMFSTANGATTGGSGALFSRESYVGISSSQWGTISAGMHRDFMFDLTVNGYSGATYGGIVASHQGPFQNFGVPYGAGGSSDFDRVNGQALTNTVKFSSPNYNGLTFGAMYGFGGQAGNFGQDSSQSFGVNYNHGSVGAGAAYTMTKYASINSGNGGIRNIGLGTAWRPAPFKVAALATWSRNTFTGAQINAYDLTVGYDFVSPFWVNVTYTYMIGNAVLSDRRAQDLSAFVGYSISKRTSVYAEIVGQRASGAGAKAQIYSTPGASSTNTQLITTIGLQHVF